MQNSKHAEIYTNESWKVDQQSFTLILKLYTSQFFDKFSF